MPLEVITESPSTGASKTPLLFVHGAWHGAWCWRNFLPFFARNGYAAHAMSWRGHGASTPVRSLRSCSIGDYANDVAEVASTLSSPPIVIAHSMGAFVMHHYLQRHRVAGVVFLAPIPPRGVWGATWHGARRHPIAFLKVNATLSLYPMVSTIERAKDLLFSSDLSDEKAAEYHRLLQDESYKGYLQMFVPVRKRPLSPCPTLVLGGANDALATESDVRSAARFYGAEWAMMDDVGHDMMLDVRWQVVAERIAGWLKSAPIAR